VFAGALSVVLKSNRTQSSFSTVLAPCPGLFRAASMLVLWPGHPLHPRGSLACPLDKALAPSLWPPRRALWGSSFRSVCHPTDTKVDQCLFVQVCVLGVRSSRCGLRLPLHGFSFEERRRVLVHCAWSVYASSEYLHRVFVLHGARWGSGLSFGGFPALVRPSRVSVHDVRWLTTSPRSPRCLPGCFLKVFAPSLRSPRCPLRAFFAK
jgi:hypothetical protein